MPQRILNAAPIITSGLLTEGVADGTMWISRGGKLSP